MTSVTANSEEESDDNVSSMGAQTSEVQQMNGARQRLLAEAEVLDHRWAHILPPLFHHQLSTALRQFLSAFLADGEPRKQGEGEPRPAVPLTRLQELDKL